MAFFLNGKESYKAVAFDPTQWHKMSIFASLDGKVTMEISQGSKKFTKTYTDNVSKSGNMKLINPCVDSYMKDIKIGRAPPGAEPYRDGTFEGDIMLESHPRGRVNIWTKGKWHSLIGHYFWDSQKGAEMLCKQLGYTGGTRYTAGKGSSIPQQITQARTCYGTEKNFFECKFAHSYGVERENDQGLSCTGTRTNAPGQLKSSAAKCENSKTKNGGKLGNS